MSGFSHLDSKGKPIMVDVGQKSVTQRQAWAQSILQMDDDIVQQLKDNDVHTKKGPVFHTAIIAGIMAVKKTSDLIPLCHPLPINKCDVDIHIDEKNDIIIDCRVRVNGMTGVEMEALTGATVAALTIYDMCKAMSHDIIIKETRLMKKTGGKRDFERA